MILLFFYVFVVASLQDCPENIFIGSNKFRNVENLYVLSTSQSTVIPGQIKKCREKLFETENQLWI